MRVQRRGRAGAGGAIVGAGKAQSLAAPRPVKRAFELACQHVHHPRKAPRRAVGRVEDRAIGRGGPSKQRGCALRRVGLHFRQKPPGPARAEEMRKVKLGVIGLAAKDRCEMRAVVLGKARRHQRGDLRIGAKRENRLPLHRIGDSGCARSRQVDQRRQPAEAEAVPMLLHRGKPGAVDELVEPGRARSSGARFGVHGGFDLGLCQQIAEVDAGRFRRAGDGGFNRRAAARRSDLAHRAAVTHGGVGAGRGFEPGADRTRRHEGRRSCAHANSA